MQTERVMASLRRSLALSFAERYLLIAIALAGNILIARLLTPEEIGLYSVSLAVIGIAQVLRDFGVGNYLIQVKQLEDGHIRTAFGFSLLIGSVLFVGVFLLAPFAGSFYSDDRLIETMRISSLNFLVLPFCTISLALLRRDMAFGRLAIVSVTATVAGFIVTISLAYAGFGPNSMAIGGVITNVVIGAGAWLATSPRRLLLPALSHWRSLLSFGAQSSASSVVTTISMDINDLALGKILGFAPVAIFSRAQGLMNLFHRDLMTAIRNVAYPAMALAHREGSSLESRYIASVSSITAVAWPFYGFTALYALEIMRLLFGPQWDEAASLVPIFCLAGAIAATSNLILNAIMAVGRIDLVTKAELIYQPLRAAAIVVTAVVFESLLACAIAYMITLALQTPLLYAFKARCIPNDYRQLFTHLWASGKVAIVTLIAPAALALSSSLGRTSPASASVFSAAIALSAISWLAALIWFRHPLTSDPLFRRIMGKICPTLRN